MSQERYEINVRRLNLRSEARKNDNAKAQLSRGQVINKLADAETAGWWEIEAVRGGDRITGFIQSEFVKPREQGRLDTEALTDLAITFARQFQTSSVLLVSIAYAESDLQENAQGTSERVGIFGFRRDAWNELVDKHRQLGIKPEMVEEWDKQIIIAAVACGQDYGPALEEALGRAPKAFEVYAAHRLSLAAAKALANADSNATVDAALTRAGIADAAAKLLVENDVDMLGTPEAPNTVEATLAKLTKKLDEGIGKANELMGMNAPENLGNLSRTHESNGKPEAIGHDRAGGWSYGLYQIAASRGSMGVFITFLEPNFPNFAQTLKDAGGEQDAINGTSVFKTAWRKLAQDPEFSKAQHAFIKTQYYDKIVLELVSIGFSVQSWPAALQDVIWSVGVQHGVAGGTNLFKNGLQPPNDSRWRDPIQSINALYDERLNLSEYFPSVPELWPNLRTRFETERRQALRMLT